jgi:hypothetical protein
MRGYHHSVVVQVEFEIANRAVIYYACPLTTRRPDHRVVLAPDWAMTRHHLIAANGIDSCQADNDLPPEISFCRGELKPHEANQRKQPG